MRLAAAGMVVGLVACTAFDDASVEPAAGAGGVSGQSGAPSAGKAGASGKAGAGAGGVAGGKAGQGGSGGSTPGGQAGQAGSGASQGGASQAGAAGKGGASSAVGGAGGESAGQGGFAGDAGGTSSGGAGSGGAGGQMSGASGQTGAGTGQGGDPSGQGGGGMQGGSGAGMGSGAMAGSPSGGQAGAGATAGAGGGGAGGANPCGSTLESDPANCGECGRVCGSGVCQQGGCLMSGILQLKGKDPMLDVSQEHGVYVAETMGTGFRVHKVSGVSSTMSSIVTPIRGVSIGMFGVGVLSGGDVLRVFPLSLQGTGTPLSPVGGAGSLPTLSPFRGTAYSAENSLVVWTGRQEAQLNWSGLSGQVQTINVPAKEITLSGVTVSGPYAYYLAGSGLYRANLMAKVAALFAASPNQGSSVAMFNGNSGVLWAVDGTAMSELLLKPVGMEPMQTLAQVKGHVIDLVTFKDDTYVLITDSAGSYVARVDPSGAVVPRARLPQGMTGTSLGVDATFLYAAANASTGSAVVRGER